MPLAPAGALFLNRVLRSSHPVQEIMGTVKNVAAALEVRKDNIGALAFGQQ